MATNFSFPNRIVLFRYLPQKTCAANPVLGHGMIKLPKPLRITRIGIRALNKPEEGWLDHKPIMPPDGSISYVDEKAIQDLLDNCDVSLKPNTTTFSEILKHIEKEGRLHRLCDILEKRHISKIWKMAGYNPTDSESAMVSLETEKWCGKSWKMNEERHLRLSLRGHPRLSLRGSFRMMILGCHNSHDYGVVYPGKSCTEKSKFLFVVERNPIYIWGDVKPCDLAFVFGDGKRLGYLQQAQQTGSLNDRITVYIRSVGPKVLVGQAWKADNKKPWRVLLLVKDCKHR